MCRRTEAHRVAISTAPRRSAVCITLLALTLIAVTSVSNDEALAAERCSVTNARTGDTSRGRGGNLQDALDAVDPGDTLRIEGICIGRFKVTVRVRLIGDPSRDWTRPVLDARGRGRVLKITAPARIHRVIIRGGATDYGGGIKFRNRGALVLSGSTLVANNRARNAGGGIYAVGFYSDVLLEGGTVVRSNVAENGGGVSTVSTVVLNDRSVVRDNRARDDGGGIRGIIAGIHLNDHASVRGNRAGRDGGGIADFDGATFLRGRARVVHNVAGRHGGGLYPWMSMLLVCSEHVRLEPNTPNDAPDVEVGC